MPDPAAPAPRPLTAEEIAEMDAEQEEFSPEVWRGSIERWTGLNIAEANLLVEVATRLQAEVESLRTRLAATTIQRDADHVIAERARNGYLPDEGPNGEHYWFHWACGGDTATPDEVAVLDAIRDSHDE